MPTTSARSVKAAMHRAQAMDLRLAGLSLDQVAEQLGFTGRSRKATAHRLIAEGMAAAVSEPAEELRKLENMRLDRLQMSAWRDAMDQKITSETRVAAINTVLRIMERRSKLNGLDRPATLKVALEQGQVDFMETTVRSLIDGIFSALASAGHEVAVAEVQDVVFGEVLPLALEAATTGPSGVVREP